MINEFGEAYTHTSGTLAIWNHFLGLVLPSMQKLVLSGRIRDLNTCNLLTRSHVRHCGI